MHPNRIWAAFMQMRNSGQFYIGQMDGPTISIYEWREAELERWKNHERLAHGQ